MQLFKTNRRDEAYLTTLSKAYTGVCIEIKSIQSIPNFEKDEGLLMRLAKKCGERDSIKTAYKSFVNTLPKA